MTNLFTYFIGAGLAPIVLIGAGIGVAFMAQSNFFNPTYVF